ncbi:hypothetical protein MHU86_25350 [Fragilaria crotonensis]|nr:hypothetical protein MHU86_25350 [Fragilaria crotonensis]
MDLPDTTQLGHRKKKRGSSPMSGSGSLGPFDAWNRNLASVVKRVLVLRIQAADASTTASESQLEDDVFGAAGDVLNLKSQYNQCSYGQLQFEPTTSNTIVGTDGVYTVSLPSTFVSGAADNPIAWAAVNKATRELGTLTKFADHVIVCMPPGTSGGWIAYGYLNHWLSVFNNEWCGYPSGLLHELGEFCFRCCKFASRASSQLTSIYNIRPQHEPSALLRGIKAVRDQSCLMLDWQFGWVAEKANAAPTDKMIIRIQGSVNDTYVSFNRRIGINSGTKKGADEVLVAIRATGLNYALSYLVAKLSGNGIYSVPNFNGSTSTLRIIVNSIDTNTIPSRANVSIDLVTPKAGPTNAPTSTPTQVPTQSPTQAPTQAPTLSPTQAPTPVPTTPAPATANPTQAPTTAPTGSPTEAPTLSPTQTPTLSRTLSPTQAPTGAPTYAQDQRCRPQQPRHLRHRRLVVPDDPRHLRHRRPRKRRPKHPPKCQL